MSDATSIDVTDKAPNARVVGKMWSCPDWCQHDDVASPGIGQSVRRGDSSEGLRVSHDWIPENHSDVNVAVSVTDTVLDDGTVSRDMFPRIYVGDEQLGLSDAQELLSALKSAVDLVTEDLDKQLRARG